MELAKGIVLEDFAGCVCEIKTMDNDLLLVGRISSANEERIDILSLDKNDKLPLIPYEKRVKLITYVSSVGFQLLMGTVYLSSDLLLSLVEVQPEQSFERRTYFRMNINSYGEITVRDPAQEVEAQQLSVKVYDVSLGGMRVGTDKKWETGDQFIIVFDLLNRKMEFTCRICREIHRDNAPKNEKQYGCEFVNCSERQLDVLCKILFELQRQEIRKKKNRD
ncbi:MAG: PilZ domain-containing protein [Oscillospiraceae bacterium]|nr:PilZ domain-containing protein [Oscillospiraceae bacterium]